MRRRWGVLQDNLVLSTFSINVNLLLSGADVLRVSLWSELDRIGDHWIVNEVLKSSTQEGGLMRGNVGYFLQNCLGLPHKHVDMYV